MLKLISALATTALLGLAVSAAQAQTAQQHNAPGGPKDRVEKLLGKSGLTLPPPPPTPPSSTVSTTTVTSPPAKPAQKK